MSKKTTFPFELIGKEVEIVDAANKCNIGVKGKVVDETKETIKIDHAGRHKILLKRTIKFQLVGTGKIISGKDVAKRPEERIKC